MGDGVVGQPGVKGHGGYGVGVVEQEVEAGAGEAGTAIY